jgi:DNA polymerase IIIc chi subunit
MTVRVDFAFGASNRFKQASSTCLKRAALGGTVLVYWASLEHFKKFEDAFWSAQEGTHFMPLYELTANTAQQPPSSVLTCSAQNLPLANLLQTEKLWLLNIENTCPEHINPIERILEIVSEDPTDIEQARIRWVKYKSQGFTVQAHSLKPTP